MGLGLRFLITNLYFWVMSLAEERVLAGKRKEEARERLKDRKTEMVMSILGKLQHFLVPMLGFASGE